MCNYSKHAHSNNLWFLIKITLVLIIITGAVIFVIYIAAFDGLSLSGGGGGNGFTGLGP